MCGQPVILQRSVLTDDGPVNGAQGTVPGFKLGGSTQPTAQASIIVLLIQAGNLRVGYHYRTRRGRNLGPKSLKPVAVDPTTSSFHAKGSTMRMLHPTDLARALTIHRGQGMSLDTATSNH